MGYAHSFIQLKTINKLIIMENIRQALENAIRAIHPMRNANGNEWIYAGSFILGEYNYSFYGSLREERVTCRCMNSNGYANHWFNLITEYDEITDKNIRSVMLIP